MADLLSDVKSRLIDKVFTAVPLRGRDPFEAISLHAAVSNQLWWMYSGPQTLEPRPRHRIPTADMAHHTR